MSDSETEQTVQRKKGRIEFNTETTKGSKKELSKNTYLLCKSNGNGKQRNNDKTNDKSRGFFCSTAQVLCVMKPDEFFCSFPSLSCFYNSRYRQLKGLKKKDHNRIPERTTKVLPKREKRSSVLDCCRWSSFLMFVPSYVSLGQTQHAHPTQQCISFCILFPYSQERNRERKFSFRENIELSPVSSIRPGILFLEWRGETVVVHAVESSLPRTTSCFPFFLS